jgi:hypothetical protein
VWEANQWSAPFWKEKDILFLLRFKLRIVKTFNISTTVGMTPLRHSKNPMTNRLSYGAAIQKSWLLKTFSI